MATRDAVPFTSELLASFLVPNDKKGKRKRDEAFGTATGDIDSCTNSQDKNGTENTSDRCASPENKRRLSSLSEESRDRDKYFDRVETYKILTWFGKPNELSPLVCARYGWKNTDFDILECVLCKAVFCGQLPKTGDKNIYTEYVNKIQEKLTSAHEKACKWASNPTPESFNYVPSLDKSESLRDFNQRLISLLHLRRQLPVVSLMSLQDEGLEEDMVVKFTDKIREQFSEYSKDTEVLRQAALLTVCGWERKNNVDKENVLTCYYCRRNVKLSSYATLQNDSDDQTDVDRMENIACRTDQSDLSNNIVNNNTANSEKDDENGEANVAEESESDVLNKPSLFHSHINGDSTDLTESVSLSQISESDIDSVNRTDLEASRENDLGKCSVLAQESENNQLQHNNGNLQTNIEIHNDRFDNNKSVSDKKGEQENSQSHNNECDINQSECNIKDKNSTDLPGKESPNDQEPTSDSGVLDEGDSSVNHVCEKGNSGKPEDSKKQTKHLDPLKEHRKWCPWINNSQSCSSCRYSLAKSAEGHTSPSATSQRRSINNSLQNRSFSVLVSNQRSPSATTESSTSDSYLNKSVSYDTVMFPWKRLMLLMYPSLLEPDVMSVSFTDRSNQVSPRDKVKRLHMMMQELQD